MVERGGLENHLLASLATTAYPKECCFKPFVDTGLPGSCLLVSLCPWVLGGNRGGKFVPWPRQQDLNLHLPAPTLSPLD